MVYTPDDLGFFDITLTDGDWAATGAATMLTSAPAAPVGSGLLWTALLAVLGGLILNVMPCVLPVLSLKLGHAIETASQGPARIRAGFLASAAGILAFMWALGVIVLAMQSMGQAVGWGMQFQSPLFLSALVLLMVLFAANMAGLFEINLPDALQRRMGGPQGAGLAGDFATGAFAAVMATPCSAPFLGTAVAFALSGGPLDVAVIFTALGLGLALPYLAIAARPRLISALPKPGAWMVKVKWVLALVLGLTAVWLLSVLWASAGTQAAAWLGGLAFGLIALLMIRVPARGLLASGIVVMGLAVPAALAKAPSGAASDTDWAALDMAVIDQEIAAGRLVFVDITADWCLTCIANKSLVLDRAPVSDLLAGDDVLAMQGDWTRPDPAIQSYLESFGRFGIPFNAVYGPGAPNGIALPELLSARNVQDAIERAR
ncbi:protein-disulfide reductase DsbD family protein [Roseobacteraceae bacterium S113]